MSESWPDAKADSCSALQVLEDELRHDLALHLYSVFLLHLRDPNVPKATFTSWPLPQKDVPDPGTLSMYIPEEQPFTSAQLKNEGKLGERIKQGDPEETLKTELNSVFQRSVYNRIHSRDQTAIVEPSAALDPVIYDELKTKLDAVLEGLFARTNDLRKTVAPLSWRDVLLQLTEDDDYDQISRRCRTLFEVKVRENFANGSSVTERKRKIDALKEQVMRQQREIKRDVQELDRGSR